MDIDALIEEICKRVMEKLKALEVAQSAPAPAPAAAPAEAPAKEEVVAVHPVAATAQSSSSSYIENRYDSARESHHSYGGAHGVPSASCLASVTQTVQDRPEKEISFCKRCLTQKDVVAADNQGATTIVIKDNTIITDVAKELIAKRAFKVVRCHDSSMMRG